MEYFLVLLLAIDLIDFVLVVVMGLVIPPEIRRVFRTTSHCCQLQLCSLATVLRHIAATTLIYSRVRKVDRSCGWPCKV